MRLLALAEWCEASTGEYDPDLCSAIHDALPEPKCVQPPNYCSSVDAALWFLPLEWTAWELRSRWGLGGYTAVISRINEDKEEDCEQGTARTPALAFCAAVFRARNAGMTPESNDQTVSVGRGKNGSISKR
jgi:hypothetical protein